MNCKTLLLCGAVIVSASTATHAQGLLKKLKDKVNQTVLGDNSTLPFNNSGTTSNKPNGNTTGAGLVITPPDVKENLITADASFKAGNYGEARYAVQQAMLGVEMEIGHLVLKAMPSAVSGLKADTAQDKVASIGWGWQGLTIERAYSNKNKELKIGIANNAVLLQAVNLYFSNASFAQTNNKQQNWKQTKLKGHKAIIEFDASSGYKLSVPIGQSSLLFFQAINFANEQEVMNAANQLDIDRIMKLLGEK